MLLPTHPEPGPASLPPAALARGGALSGAGAGLASAAGASSADASLRLQLVTSIARVQDMRLHDGRVEMLVGCNRACLLQARGSVRVNGSTLALHGVRVGLTGAHALNLSLALAPAQLSRLRRTLGAGASAPSSLTLLASTPGQPERSYAAHVRLTYR